MERETITLAWLISRLTNLAVEHGYDTPVLIHDADTDWSLNLKEDGVRFGLNEFGEGRENAVMIQSAGYHG